MRFVCSHCKQAGLLVTQTLELRSDDQYDEIQLQLLNCEICGYQLAGVYQESRRGMLDGEIVCHQGLLLKSSDLQRLGELFQACPHPADRWCNCETHQALGTGNTLEERLANLGISIWKTINL